MKKILAIIGSPRGAGNCVTMAREVCRNVPQGHELRLLKLSDFSIKPCRACYRCLFGDKKCVIDDDLELIIGQMKEADAYIVAVPAYFLGANALLKLLLDRGLAFYGHAEKLWGKPSIGIGVAGIDGKEGSTLLEIQRFQKIFLSDIKQSVIVYGALPGEVLVNGANRKIAEELGRRLFGDPYINRGPVCSECGGDTFRFLDEKNVSCMLCSNRGSFSYTEGKPVFQIEKSDHELLSSRDNALNHEKWLVGMKERYLEKRDELGEITREYLKDGNWIKPLKKPD